MASSQLDGFHQSWKKQKTLMVERHDDERMHYKREREDKERSAIHHAQRQLENLRDAICPANFPNEALRIQQDRDATLLSIQKDYDEHIHFIKEIQRKEKMNHERAYHDAIAARSFRNGTSPAHSAAIADTTDDAQAVIGSRSRSPPSNDRMLPVEDDIPTVATSRQQDQSAGSEKTFSCTVQPLQESTESHVKRLHIDTSVNPFPTPAPTVSAADDHPQGPRTITFGEVYQNGQAKHKDTIIEFPPDSRQWYILKCEEHQMRFNQRALQGAAKHLSGRLHGHQNRSRALAVKIFGYKVIDCNEQLAELNNQAVDDAFANGYKPIRISFGKTMPGRTESRVAIAKPGESEVSISAIQKASGNPSQGAGALAVSEKKAAASLSERRRQSSSSSSRKYPKISQESSDEIITNPKPFHVYYGYWKPEDSIWPVMILGWDDQTAGGLKDDLVGTGLLNRKNSNPPKCYVYKDNTMKNAMDNAIVGWAPGFEDGGPKVTQRKFPVMFFDSDQSVSWVSARSLSRFPLYDPKPPKKDDHPFNEARRWVAKKEGFASWEEFERARKGEEKGETADSVAMPHLFASPITPGDDSGSDSDAESSSSSVASNVTEKELLEMRDKAGEIADDADYSESDIDSSLGEEHETWEQEIGASDGRPWAFYGLRSTENAKSEKYRSSSPSHNTKLTNTEMKSSVHEGMELARSLATRACTQEDSCSTKANYEPETSSRDNSSKGAEENAAQDSNDKIPSSTPLTDPCGASSAKQVTPQLQQMGLSVHAAQAAQAVDNKFVKEDFSFILRTSRNVLSGLPTAQADSGETSKGTKRVRSEDKIETGIGAVGQEPAKKAKLDIQPRLQESGILDAEVKSLDRAENEVADAATMDNSDKQVATSTAPKPEVKLACPVLPTFIPKVPLEPAAYELSSYSKGPISWNREGSEPCVPLYYGKGDRMLGTVDSPLSVVIEPIALKGLTREEIPGSKGNSIMTLLGKDEGDAPVRLVFDRTKESKANIGRVQVRSFLRWVRTVNAEVRVLES